MRVKLLSLAIAIAMLSSVGGTSIFARPATDPKIPEEAKASPNSVPAGKDRAASNVKLEGDLRKLVTDAKAGKVAPRAQQFPNTKRNNLSTGAKIGIVAAIGGLIFALIVISKLNSDDD